MTNGQLYEEAMKAISALYSDRSVSVDKCRENMDSLIGEIGIMKDALPESEE